MLIFTPQITVLYLNLLLTTISGATITATSNYYVLYTWFNNGKINFLKYHVTIG
ncbi:MAG: hypothetical protein JXR58_00100 [Bacteroidales bacterium]|nr:hypothetical protein [Bacteroidales bacterium]